MNHPFTTLAIDHPTPHILRITLNRPQLRNAMDSVMMRELRDVWQNLYVDCGEARVVVLTGAGDKAFCAGADLKERNGLDVKTWQAQHAVLEQAMVAMLTCPIPIIAAVNGAAFGGGLELMLACDFAYAADHASFGLPEPTIGIMPGAMGTQNLPRACGTRRASELCFTGAPFSAREALEWGVINKICAADQLMDDALNTARHIAANAPLAIRQIKKSIAATQQMPLAAGYAFEIEAYNQLIPTHDRSEGIRAFNEKRVAEFKGV